MGNAVNFDFKCRMVDEELKSFWPEWQVVRRLGGGSFGDVFHITRTKMGLRSDSAMKVIQIMDEAEPTTLLKKIDGSGRSMSGSTSDRSYEGDTGIQQTSPLPMSVYNEIRIMETLRGAPNIVAIEDFYYKRDPHGSNAARLYIRMELLTSFQELMSGKGASNFLAVPEICKFATDICTALDYCEKNNIIHRDIKPANMFVDRFGNYKVGDFGASRSVQSLQLAQTMTGIGTISYMAPEIYNRTAYDHTVDIYALGLVLYQLLNRGRAPFLPDYPSEYTTADIDTANFNRLHGKVIRKLANADPELDVIVRKACAFDAKDRYQTAAEMKQAVERYLDCVKRYSLHTVKLQEDSAIQVNAANVKKVGQGNTTTENDKEKPFISSSSLTAGGEPIRHRSVSMSDIPAQKPAGSKEDKRKNKDGFRKSMRKPTVILPIMAVVTILLMARCIHIVVERSHKKEQYAAYLTDARNTMEFDTKIANYKHAIDLDPGNPEAYQGLIDDIEGLSDGEFISAYNSIADCINGVDYWLDHHSDHLKYNIEYLKDKDIATYADFNFRLGMLVYLLYPSGQVQSITYLSEAVEAKGLSAERQESAELILELAELYKKTKEAGAGGKQRIEFENEFADFWNTLDELSIRLDTLNEQTNIGYPIRICSAIAYEINHRCVSYKNDNVQRETVQQTLDRAKAFMDRATSSSPDQQEAIEDVRRSIDEAYKSINDTFSNTSTGNPEAFGTHNSVFLTGKMFSG